MDFSFYILQRIYGIDPFFIFITGNILLNHALSILPRVYFEMVLSVFDHQTLLQYDNEVLVSLIIRRVYSFLPKLCILTSWHWLVHDVLVYIACISTDDTRVNLDLQYCKWWLTHQIYRILIPKWSSSFKPLNVRMLRNILSVILYAIENLLHLQFLEWMVSYNRYANNRDECYETVLYRSMFTHTLHIIFCYRKTSIVQLSCNSPSIFSYISLFFSCPLDWKRI